MRVVPSPNKTSRLSVERRHNFCPNLIDLVRYLVVAIVFCGYLTPASAVDAFAQIESKQIELVNPQSPYFSEQEDRYPWLARILLWEGLKYYPPEPTEQTTKECSSKVWQEKPANFSNIEKYVQRCEKQIRKPWVNILSETYRTMMIKLNPSNLSRARYVVFHLPNQIKLKGLLALKPGQEKRPLVILRLGIFSNVTEFFPERYLFYQLFEHAPFHLLILESHSGHEFIRRNKVLALGGFDEGISNYQVASLVRDSQQKISQLISSVHLVGVSFGGHGIFYAHLLNELNKPVISSSIALCPLVNFQETLKMHQSQGVISRFIEYWTKFRMKNLNQIFPHFRGNDFLQNIIEHLEQRYQGPITLDSKQPLRLHVDHQMNDFWKMNDFWAAYKNVQTPLLVFATTDDPIVPFALNGKKILDGKMNLGSSKLKIIEFPRGIHCSFPGSYQWLPFQSLLQQFILSSQKDTF